MVSRTMIVSSAAGAPITPKPEAGQVGFETAVIAVIFAHKLKVAVARTRKQLAMMSVDNGLSLPCRAVTADGFPALSVVEC